MGHIGAAQTPEIFAHSSFGEMLRENTLDLPENCLLLGTSEPPLPYFFVGDEAFALGEHLMRPYSNHNLNVEKRIFNYRLTSAMRVVECAFGILANKWHLRHGPISLNLENAISAVKATCILHNFVRQRDGYLFEDSLIQSHWTANRGSNNVAKIREHFPSYFMSPAGEVAWRLNAIL